MRGWRSRVRGLRGIVVDLASPGRRLAQLSAASRHGDTPALQRRIAIRQFRALVHNYPALLVPQCAGVLLWLAMGWHYNPGWIAIAWGAASAVCTACIVLFLVGFARSQPADEGLRAWEVRLGWLTWALSVTWGLGAWTAPNHPVVAPYNALGSLLVVAALLSLHTIYRPSIAWIALPCAGVTAVTFLLLGGWLYAGLAVCYLLAVGLLVRLAWTRNALVTQLMIASEERLALLQQIESQRAAAQQANEAKTRFLAAVSHDLRQPMHAIALLTLALRQHSQDRGEVIDQLAASVQGMNDLLGALPQAADARAGHLAPWHGVSAATEAGKPEPVASVPAGAAQPGPAGTARWMRTLADGVRETVGDLARPWRLNEDASTQAHHGPAIAQRIAVRQMRTLFERRPTDLIAPLAGGALGTTALALIAPGPKVAAWGLCMLALLGAAWGLGRRYAREQPSDAALRPWEAWQGRLAIVQGLAWGSIWFVIPFTAWTPTPYLATGLLLVTAGSISRCVRHRPAVSWRAVPCAVLTCIGLMAHARVHDAIIGLGFAVAVASMVWLGRVQNALITRSMQVAEERILLLEELEGQRAAAQQASEAKTRFLAAVGHDLRQPMHSISLLSGALRGPSDAQTETLGQIGASVQAMDDMLEALLQVSRLDDGALPLQWAPLAVAPLFERLALQFAAQAAAKGLALTVQPCQVRIRSDAYQLQRMLANLVANAIRYTPQGQVTLRCRTRGNLAWLQVWDSGSGIAREDRERIFEEFVQVANPQRSAAEGVGLGLSIVQRLAQRLHHPVVLRSRPGRGSLFAIGVPLDSAATASDEAALARLLGGQLVLLIDDDAVVRHSMALFLGAFDCHVLAAHSTASALDVVQASLRTPDLILSDFWLGEDETGLQAIAQVRADLDEAVPALLVTAELGEARAAARPHGIPVLAKPLRAHSLVPALAQALQTTGGECLERNEPLFTQDRPSLGGT